MKKLFPKKGKEKDRLVTSVKGFSRQLGIRARGYAKRADVSRRNASIALKRRERDRAKTYLVQYKQYQMKADRTNNIRAKFDRQIEAIEEGIAIQESGKYMSSIRDMLKQIAKVASPERIAEISEDSEMYVTEIEEAGEILAGDPEIDLGIDISEELNMLESEMILGTTEQMPEVPVGDLPEYIVDVEAGEEASEIDTKEKLQNEIEKLKKELEG
jgi:hypothetical protein